MTQRTIKKLKDYLTEPVREALRKEYVFPEEQEQLRQCLTEALGRAKEIASSLNGHCSYKEAPYLAESQYFGRMYRLKQFLMRKDWSGACSELISVVHYFHVEDHRVLDELIFIMEGTLDKWNF